MTVANVTALHCDVCHAADTGSVLKIFNLCDVDGSLRIEQQKNLRVGRTNLTFSSVDVQWNPHHGAFKRRQRPRCTPLVACMLCI